MIDITNDSYYFFNSSDPVYICDADYEGYWTGNYMKRCHIDFNGYFATRMQHDRAFIEGKEVFPVKRLIERRDEPMCVVCCSRNYLQIIRLLQKYDMHNKSRLLCLIPEYKDSINGKIKYNINRLLGYFRRKLYTGEKLPLFITSDCYAGIIYEYLGMPLASPFINTHMSAEDFLKVCIEPKSYLEASLTDFHWGYNFVGRKVAPEAILNDITLQFPHESKDDDSIFDEIYKRWEMMRRTDVENSFFIFHNARMPVTISQRKAFSEIPYRRLFLQERADYNDSFSREILISDKMLEHRDEIYEKTFDLLDYIENYELYD